MSSTVMATSPIEELLAQHPRLLKAWHVLKILWKGVCIFIDWTLGLKIVVWFGARLILTVGRSSETLLLFATLWATGQQVQAEWIDGLFGVHGPNITGSIPDHLNGLTTVVFSLVPEIILPYAILTTIKHWQTTCQQKTKGGRAYYGLWALLYTVPTVVFLGLTLITLKNMGSGNFADAAAGTMNVRSLASWSYALIEMLYPMITPLATHRSKTETAIETAIIEANDRLALENQKKLDKLTEQQKANDQKIEQLHKTLEKLIDLVDQKQSANHDGLPEMIASLIQPQLQVAVQNLTQVTVSLVDDRLNQVVQSLPPVHKQPVLMPPAHKQATLPEQKAVHKQPVFTENTEKKNSGVDTQTGQSDEAIDEQIKRLLVDNPELSDRAIARQIGCSPTTVGRKRARLSLPAEVYNV